ncbi:hypothetical protein AB0L97_06060, partial [Nocardia sp. NPDC051911]|uniref:hypothetical protein n=1 Tax=Nocardia sp. NPDC051911 TaxID=3154648 RepID=UPI00342FB585
VIGNDYIWPRRSAKAIRERGREPGRERRMLGLASLESRGRGALGARCWDQPTRMFAAARRPA